MDGVLVDLFSEITKLSEYPITHWKDLSKTDLEVVFRKTHGTDFFYTLPKFPMTNTLLYCIQKIAGKFSILSSPVPGDEENCAYHKRKWIHENVPFDVEEIIITSDKHLYANGNVLIDDYIVNIHKWEASGGYGIRFQANQDKISDVLFVLKTLYEKER